MKLDFCCVCGTKEDLQQHHIVPVVLSGIKRVNYDENDTDTITVCGQHHAVIHGITKSNAASHGKLIRVGMEKAKKNGTIIGRPTVLDDNLLSAIKEKRKNGMGIRAIGKELKVGIGTLYKSFIMMDIIDQKNSGEFEDNPPSWLDLYEEPKEPEKKAELELHDIIEDEPASILDLYN